MKNTAIFLANGHQTRFGVDQTPKQLVNIFGKPLLHDSWSKFAPLFDRMFVITRNEEIKKSLRSIAPTSCINIGVTSGLRETMLKSRRWWGTERTTFLFGDCFYSFDAVKIITNCALEYAHICRTTHSEFTGKPYGESFAMTWTHHQNESVAQALALKPEGTSWEFYREMSGLVHLPPDKNYLHESPPCLLQVNDFTDDFDSLVDYQRWLECYELHLRHQEERQAIFQRFRT